MGVLNTTTDLQLLLYISAICLPSSVVSVTLTQTSRACYSSGGDCGFHKLSCTPGLVVALTALNYGFKKPSLYGDLACQQVLIDCAKYVGETRSCCSYDPRTDCRKPYSGAHHQAVTDSCQGKRSCSLHATYVSGGCRNPPLVYNDVSTFSVIDYLCVNATTGTTTSGPQPGGEGGTRVTWQPAVGTGTGTSASGHNNHQGCVGCSPATSSAGTTNDTRDIQREREEDELELIVGVSVGVGSGVIALVVIAVVCWIRMKRKLPESASASVRSGGDRPLSSPAHRRTSSSSFRTHTATSSLPSTLHSSSFYYSDTLPSSHQSSVYTTPGDLSAGQNNSLGRPDIRHLNYDLEEQEKTVAVTSDSLSRMRNYGYDSHNDPPPVVSGSHSLHRNNGFGKLPEKQAPVAGSLSRLRNYGYQEELAAVVSGKSWGRVNGSSGAELPGGPRAVSGRNLPSGQSPSAPPPRPLPKPPQGVGTGRFPALNERGGGSHAHVGLPQPGGEKRWDPDVPEQRDFVAPAADSRSRVLPKLRAALPTTTTGAASPNVGYRPSYYEATSPENSRNSNSYYDQPIRRSLTNLPQRPPPINGALTTNASTTTHIPSNHTSSASLPRPKTDERWTNDRDGPPPVGDADPPVYAVPDKRGTQPRGGFHSDTISIPDKNVTRSQGGYYSENISGRSRPNLQQTSPDRSSQPSRSPDHPTAPRFDPSTTTRQIHRPPDHQRNLQRYNSHDFNHVSIDEAGSLTNLQLWS